jgi:hypothetical protein
LTTMKIEAIMILSKIWSHEFKHKMEKFLYKYCVLSKIHRQFGTHFVNSRPEAFRLFPSLFSRARAPNFSGYFQF